MKGLRKSRSNRYKKEFFRSTLFTASKKLNALLFSGRKASRNSAAIKEGCKSKSRGQIAGSKRIFFVPLLPRPPKDECAILFWFRALAGNLKLGGLEIFFQHD